MGIGLYGRRMGMCAHAQGYALCAHEHLLCPWGAVQLAWECRLHRHMLLSSSARVFHLDSAFPGGRRECFQSLPSADKYFIACFRHSGRQLS